MRGIQNSLLQTDERERFIPADAGNTSAFAVDSLWNLVHPRGCGEYMSAGWSSSAHRGSSPRMRGIRKLLEEVGGGDPVHPRGCGEYARLHQVVKLCWRFIPADAGNTYSCPCQITFPPVHPRGCGEYPCTSSSYPSATGSSPRMRGIPIQCRAHGHSGRFIPADAGNTVWTPPTKP